MGRIHLRKIKRRKAFLVILLAVSMMAVMMRTGLQAAGTGDAGRNTVPYNPAAKGSVTVQLQDLGTDMENVQLSLCRVGSVDTSSNYIRFDLIEELKDCPVDLNAVSNNREAAAKLQEAVQSAGLGVQKGLTDADGKCVFEDLEQGVYLVAQRTQGAYGVILPFLVGIPHMGNGSDWMYDVTVNPKGADMEEWKGSITVTKFLKFLDGDTLINTKTKDGTYYVGLFVDSEGTIPYGGKGKNVKPIHIEDNYYGTAVFENLPKAIYYVYETDAEGNAIPYQTRQTTGQHEWFAIAGEDILAGNAGTAPEIELNGEVAYGSASISNIYYSMPDGFYSVAGVSITKSVTYNGNMITSGDTFYAGVFKKDAFGGDTPVKVILLGEDGSRTETGVIPLKQNSKVTAEVPLDEKDVSKTVTYTVRETDEKGSPVDKETFPYKVTGEGDITVSSGAPAADVHITNDLGDSDGYYEDSTADFSESAIEGGSSTESGEGSGGSNTGSGSAKTSDNTPTALYAGLLAAALLVGGIVIIKRKR